MSGRGPRSMRLDQQAPQPNPTSETRRERHIRMLTDVREKLQSLRERFIARGLLAPHPAVTRADVTTARHVPCPLDRELWARVVLDGDVSISWVPRAALASYLGTSSKGALPNGVPSENVSMKLNAYDHAVAVVAEPVGGPGWANTPLWVIVQDGNGNLRRECLQPDKQSVGIRLLYAAAVAVHGALVREVEALSKKPKSTARKR